jgi:intermediate cleaving peptidase 55
VTPGITALEYAHRRSKLASKLPKNTVAIVAASDVKYRSGSVFYEYHQDPDFFYLTGVTSFNPFPLSAQATYYSQALMNREPWLSLVSAKGCSMLSMQYSSALANDGSDNDHIFHLYVREKDPKAEMWEGARSGTRAAIDVFNADEVRINPQLLTSW